VTTTTVNFQGNCIQTGSGTSVPTSFGNLLPIVTGTIVNLPVSPPGNPFMVFIVGGQNLNFFLSGTGPGVSNTVCSGTFDPNQPSCSVFAGSPFILSPGPGGTTVRLAAHGGADANGTSIWNGTFSMDFANITPLDLRNQFVATGTFAATTFTGSFGVVGPSGVPEPTTVSMLGLGLLGVALLGRRKVHK
jgi:hypothetical protein